MRNCRLRIADCRLPVILLLIAVFSFLGCQKVDKPVRGEEGSGPMAIVIEGDPPDSHTKNITFEGRKLVNPYSKIPVVGSLFKSGLTGLDFWKAHHPVLVTGTHNPGLIVETEDEEELCLDCHDPGTSCNNCHSYVGVQLVSSDE